MDLILGTYKPYNKPNNQPLYINKQSNHPPNTIKNIVTGVNKRLSDISSNETIFNEAAPLYQKALDDSGYNVKLKYNKEENNLNNNSNHKRRNRQRKQNTIWFNPPYSMNVSTRVGAKFLKLLDDCFPEDHPLHKIFNRNTVKVSYKTTPNMGQIVTGHNKHIIKTNKQQNQPEDVVERSCNCKTKKDPMGEKCPLGNKCLHSAIVYQATVTEVVTKKTETYIGLTADPFKTRLANHTKSFKHEKYETDSDLSKHIWKLKRGNIEYKIQWKILDRARTFNPVFRTCQLCIREKYYIIFKPELCTLNQRSEFGTHCRHQRSLLHCNFKPKP